MWQSKISLRLILSFLAVVVLSISLLGYYLLHFFYNYNLELQQNNLIRTGKIVETLLADRLEPSYFNRPDSLLNQELQQITKQTNMRITLIDTSGKVISDSEHISKIPDNHLNREEIRTAITDHELGMAIRHSKTLNYNMLYVAIPVYNSRGELHGIIRTSTSLEHIENTYIHIRNSIIVALILTIIATIIVAMVLANRQIRPIRQMTSDAYDIIHGNLHRRLHVTTDDELSVLASTINTLTTNLLHQIDETRYIANQQALILENMDNAVVLLDEHGFIKLANQQARQLFNLPPHYLGKNIISLLGNTTLSSIARKAIHANAPRQRIIKLKFPQGSKSLSVFLAPFIENNLHYVVCVFHDISLIYEIAQRQTDFVSNAAHELATPLTSIAGYAETLLDDDFSHPDCSKRFLQTIYDEAQRMNKLLRELLQLAKLDTNDYRQQLNIEPVNALSLGVKVYQLLHHHAAQKQQQLQVITDDSPETAVYIEANPDLLLQALLNITENALKYTPEGGSIEVHTSIIANTSTQHDAPYTVHYTIIDNGIGMSPHDLPLIFERFYRVDKARSRASGGNGIGLSLAKFVVELFAGTITVDSKKGEGTTFTLEFPGTPN